MDTRGTQELQRLDIDWRRLERRTSSNSRIASSSSSAGLLAIAARASDGGANRAKKRKRARWNEAALFILLPAWERYRRARAAWESTVPLWAPDGNGARGHASGFEPV
ncbi:hypothetical protein Y032_0049g1843 [Ancylostoma ceylanicum]|uniref:Uncharacterized protein n=1 Tax=Ancylostoma ceylanicum TaxID=53326 RepID=A0A016U9B2_9BILA|nr:hypothetical protein Y032_0049g1843 [Ancylostoma ceylanicum]